MQIQMANMRMNGIMSTSLSVRKLLLFLPLFIFFLLTLLLKALEPHKNKLHHQAARTDGNALEPHSDPE